jgi:hypothetical protein
MLERVMARYGVAMVWRGADGEKNVRAFFQPATLRSWKVMKREVTALGSVPLGLYIYIGPASCRINVGDFLQVGQQEYRIQRVECIYDSKGLAYCWGLCAQKGR